MRPSNMKWTETKAIRCVRCGRWPDQHTGVGGDWLVQPARLCPGCHERMVFKAVRHGNTTEHEIVSYITQRLKHRV
jgi:hypothetical protein